MIELLYDLHRALFFSWSSVNGSFLLSSHFKAKHVQYSDYFNIRCNYDSHKTLEYFSLVNSALLPTSRIALCLWGHKDYPMGFGLV